MKQPAPYTELSMLWVFELQVYCGLDAVPCRCYFPASMLACFRKQYHPFLPVWRGSDTGLGLILPRICWEVCALYFKIWSCGKCNAEILNGSCIVSWSLTGFVSFKCKLSPCETVPTIFTFQCSDSVKLSTIGVIMVILELKLESSILKTA